jgi:AcrR family transcriptional regulator
MIDSGSAQTLSRRERRKWEREQRILDAAAAVFAEKGYHQATIRDIAELADVADGTIYNYFDNKFDLLVGLLARLADLERLPEELLEALHGDFRDSLVVAFQERMVRIKQGEELIKAILPQVFIDERLRERFYRQYVLRISRILEPYVQARVEAGEIRPVDVPLTVRIVQGQFIGLLVLHILGDEPLRAGWDDVPELFATLLFDGLNRGEGG